MDERTILHCDCNSFFASVETALHPEFGDVPMAVCGKVEDRHGIVLAKNEKAKKYGICTAETVYSARRKCPDLVICEPHYEEYVRFSRRVGEIYSRYTDQIEPFGIDESWLDVTASRRLFGDGPAIAERIRREVREEVGITVSIGVSFNKVFAKLGSDYKKPDAVTVISRDNFRQIVYPLPVGDLLFVGHKTEERLAAMGIRTIGDLASFSRETLTKRLGRAGEILSKYAKGEDDSPVAPGDGEDAKSVSNGFTFRHDLHSDEEYRIGVDYLCEEIGMRLRRQGQKCTTVQVTIKDEYLRTMQRQCPLAPPSDVGQTIADTAYRLILNAWPERKPVRMITVTAAGLVRRDMVAEQIDLLGGAMEKKREKSSKKENAVDKIRQKYGSDSIIRGAVMDTDLGIYDGKKEISKNDPPGTE